MLVHLSPTAPLYYPMRSQGCMNGLYHKAERYLSLSNQSVIIMKSSHNFHATTLYTHNPRTCCSYIFSVFKVISYATILFPLIALFIRTLGRANQHYFSYAQNQDVQMSAFIQAFQKNNLQDMQKLYALDPTAITLQLNDARYGNISLFLAACLENKIEVLDWLIKKDPQLIHQKNKDGLTTFEVILKTWSPGCLTTDTLKWLYQQGAGRGLFLAACSNNDLTQGQKLFDAIGVSILQETNETGINHFINACYTPGTNKKAHQTANALVRMFAKASRGQINTISLNHRKCSGSILNFILQQGCPDKKA
jgi:hypothetical protein